MGVGSDRFPLPNLTQLWKFLRAPIGSTTYCTYGLGFPTCSTISGVRGAAGGCHTAAAKSLCKYIKWFLRFEREGKVSKCHLSSRPQTGSVGSGLGVSNSLLRPFSSRVAIPSLCRHISACTLSGSCAAAEHGRRAWRPCVDKINCAA